MLDSLTTFYKTNKSPMNFSNYQSFFTNMVSKSKKYIQSIEAKKTISTLSPAINTIKRIIDIFPTNISELKTIKSNISLIYYIENMLENLVSDLGIYIKKHYLTDTFIKGLDFISTNEVILYTVNLLPLKYYSIINTSIQNLNGLEILSPLKIISNKSYEYTLHTENHQLIYHYDVPSIIFLTLDIKLLLYIWYKYNIYKTIKKQPIDFKEFYHQYVHLGMIYYNQNNWIINFLNEMIDRVLIASSINDIQQEDLYIDIIDNRFSYIKTSFNKIFTECKRRLIDVKNKNIHPTVFMKSISLIGDTNLPFNISNYIEYISDLNAFNDIPEFQWINITKDYPYVNFIISLYNLYNNQSENRKLKNKLLYLISRIHSNKIYNYVSDVFLKDYIKNDIIFKLERKIQRLNI